MDALYQLSYRGIVHGAGGRIRTCEGECQLIYSQSCLSTSLPQRINFILVGAYYFISYLANLPASTAIEFLFVISFHGIKNFLPLPA